MKGINFKEPLFHKVVSGEKNQTRRIIKPQPYMYNDGERVHLAYRWGNVKDGYSMPLPLPNSPQYGLLYQDSNFEKPLYPRYKIGERVFLKEPYIYDEYGDGSPYAAYKSYDKYDRLVKWRNKLFMPAEYARYFIEITGVKAEQLQDISDEDCIKEGIFKHISHATLYWKFPGSGDMYFYSPREAYAALIDKINGKGTWDRNPWVWAYDFKLINI